MPTTIQHLQKHFKLSVKDDLPEVPIEAKGQGRWLMCCPLCGCQHQIIGVDEQQPYTPVCQTYPILYKAEILAWGKLNPEVVKYKKLHLMADAT